MKFAFQTSVPFSFKLTKLSLALVVQGSQYPQTLGFCSISMKSSPVHESRVTLLKTGVEPKSATHVHYWMSNSLRSLENPSLEHAAYLSNKHKLPLRVTHILDSTAPDGEPLPERHALFQLQAARDVANALRDRRIPFQIYYSLGDIVSVLGKVTDGAAAFITDADYLRPGRELRHALAKRLSVPIYVVEANVVVPVETASDKLEYAARTIRPKITRAMSDYLVATEQVELEFQPKKLPTSKKNDKNKDDGIISVSVNDKDEIDAALADWKGLDREAPSVHLFEGGEKAAQKLLKEFAESNLAQYDEGRNEPALQLQSDLSPYLRLGCISPIDIALKVKKQVNDKSKLASSRDSFLEELVVRRELAVNACWYNERYDEYDHVVPDFAKKTLAEHKSDKREHVYTYEELEAGVTHDEFWNAAQLEMVVRGKMHGYMRMYWAKQILGWVEDPVDAMRIATRLNNRWELDAVDPNSFVGVNWCFGLHDHGWAERSVWGKVRYMNSSGLKRKFNMDAYVSKIDSLIDEHGLPPHISKLQNDRNKNKKKQTKIDKNTSHKKKSAQKSSNKDQSPSTRASKRSKRSS